MCAQAEVTANAIGEMGITQNPDGAYRRISATMAIVVLKEPLATRVQTDGWSATINVQGRETDSANGTWMLTTGNPILKPVFRMNSATSVIVVPREARAIHVPLASKSVTTSAQAKAIGNANGQTRKTRLGGAFPQTHAKEAIAARREHLAIHAHLVGW